MTDRAGWRDPRGQTFTEYTMILGLLTAILLSLTVVVVPGLAVAVRLVVNHMAIYLTSVQP